ncbi:hypothetical protein RQP53_16640 [Paucibacter sp. APW11]|uniref:Uncharacterized protein n=1 Tax=Roseateles aquae TaxID=3077235 RepID=A0ABU3PE64_9BURK|nr:hypothetical protein [Paucibacter sp. APW11]MDT9000906.1 hypothetical protein [Paucibacter sp. APW11]
MEYFSVFKGTQMMNPTTRNEDQTNSSPTVLVVAMPDKESSKGYVNTRGASLNYVRRNSDNKETAYCSDRDA